MNIKQYEETSVRGPEEYKQSILPKRLEDMKPAMSLKQEVERNEYLTKANILNIMVRWLALNVKGRSLTESAQMDLIIDHFITFCSNLELQEVEFIFREGIKGRYGVIFNAIDIDTICGKDGWIEQYYRDHRSMRPEPAMKEISVENPNAITEREFLKRNPEYKRSKMIARLQEWVKSNNASVKKCHAKYYLKLIGNTQDDYKKILTKIHHEYTSSYYKKITTLKEYARAKFVGIILENRV